MPPCDRLGMVVPWKRLVNGQSRSRSLSRIDAAKLGSVGRRILRAPPRATTRFSAMVALDPILLHFPPAESSRGEFHSGAEEGCEAR